MVLTFEETRAYEKYVSFVLLDLMNWKMLKNGESLLVESFERGSTDEERRGASHCGRH
jgi:hypothetical protein